MDVTDIHVQIISLFIVTLWVNLKTSNGLTYFMMHVLRGKKHALLTLRSSGVNLGIIHILIRVI